MKIHLARISTNADQALDVFYISDPEGNKVTELERMRSIKTALLERLEGAAGDWRQRLSAGELDGTRVKAVEVRGEAQA